MIALTECGNWFGSIGAQTPNDQSPNLEDDLCTFSRSCEDDLNISFSCGYLILKYLGAHPLRKLVASSSRKWWIWAKDGRWYNALWH